MCHKRLMTRRFVTISLCALTLYSCTVFATRYYVWRPQHGPAPLPPAFSAGLCSSKGLALRTAVSSGGKIIKDVRYTDKICVDLYPYGETVSRYSLCDRWSYICGDSWAHAAKLPACSAGYARCSRMLKARSPSRFVRRGTNFNKFSNA